MSINDKVKDKKLQYDINREAAKISALSSDKTDKCEFLTGEEFLPSDQSKIIEQAKFTFSRLDKAFENQIKTIEDQGKKLIKTGMKETQRLLLMQILSYTKKFFFFYISSLNTI